MRSAFDDDTSSNKTQLNVAEALPQLKLLVIQGDSISSYPLPAAGELIVGRTAESDIVIPCASISRRHLRLRVGRELKVEDLGSSNGSRLRNAPLEPGKLATLSPGEVVELPGATILFQADSGPLRQRRLWSHGYFEARFEDECERARISRTSLALARLQFVHDNPLAVQEMLFAGLRPLDVVANYGPNEYELLLLDTARSQAEQRLHALRLQLESLGAKVRVGAAYFPSDGREPQALAARAGAELHGSLEEVDEADVIIRDPAMKRLYGMVDEVAASNISALLLGETGVGKEIVAEQVHRRSPRAGKPLLRLNCAALPEPLLESELFGHERGAFTGAVQAKPGLIESAEGGTVFLDEVGELPLSIQAKLLRVLEERRVLRVGGLKEKQVDVRFISATNRNLEAEISRRAFRADLYYRLNGITLEIPPLRKRPLEIEALALLFVARASKQFGRPPLVLSRVAREAILSYAWPGNIRELRNVIDRAVLLCKQGEIGLDHLPMDKMSATLPPAAEHAPARPPIPIRGRWMSEDEPVNTLEFLAPTDGIPGQQHLERQRIMQALEQCGGNQTQAAKLLGISRRTLVNRLGEYDLPRPRKRRF